MRKRAATGCRAGRCCGAEAWIAPIRVSTGPLRARALPTPELMLQCDCGVGALLLLPCYSRHPVWDSGSMRGESQVPLSHGNRGARGAPGVECAGLLHGGIRRDAAKTSLSCHHQLGDPECLRERSPGRAPERHSGIRHPLPWGGLRHRRLHEQSGRSLRGKYQILDRDGNVAGGVVGPVGNSPVFVQGVHRTLIVGCQHP